MDVTRVNPLEVLQQWVVRNAHTSSFVDSAGTVPVTAVRGFLYFMLLFLMVHEYFAFHHVSM